ncbi:hypothetical protein AB0M95_30295 [Sphaerisporangium sp. NPDC051017]|uniref:hypothetical protein n=1 Tax=Sphaerisporangium sp. NPDC051017 TaxID=3154636 RepID=UPI00343C7DD9
MPGSARARQSLPETTTSRTHAQLLSARRTSSGHRALASRIIRRSGRASPHTLSCGPSRNAAWGWWGRAVSVVVVWAGALEGAGAV